MTYPNEENLKNPPIDSRTAAELNRFVKAELAAAATYERALGHVDRAETRTVFEQNRRSHADRSVAIAQLVAAHGAVPANKAGPWGALAKLVEAGASMIGERAIIKTLHEGEAVALGRYLEAIDDLDPVTLEVINGTVLPQQQKTEASLRALLA